MTRWEEWGTEQLGCSYHYMTDKYLVLFVTNVGTSLDQTQSTCCAYFYTCTYYILTE